MSRPNADIAKATFMTHLGHRGYCCFAMRHERKAVQKSHRHCRDHSALILAARITLAHFSVSVAMNLAKSEDEPGNAAAPRSANRAFNLASTRPALISLFSLSTISADVSLGAPMPCSALAS